jgi:chromosome segregation ATPase
LEEMKRQLEQLDLDKNQAVKRMKEKEKKIQTLEGKISDMEEDKLSHFREF